MNKIIVDTNLTEERIETKEALDRVQKTVEETAAKVEKNISELSAAVVESMGEA